MHTVTDDVDDFGYDAAYDEKLSPVLDFLYDTYFRVEVEGGADLPRERCLLVANHSGPLPFDGLMLKLAARKFHIRPRNVRWLTEDFLFHFPFLGSVLNRIGAVRACQENAERLLAQQSLVAVFPEGSKGTGKLFRDRYRLQRFGRGGFIKLALRTQSPIVPVAIVGAEEANPVVARFDALAKPLGLPYLPVTPTFPLLGPLGLLPIPSKWKIVFGPTIFLDEYEPAQAEDDVLVGRLSEQVRASLQAMLDRLIEARTSVFFG